MQRSQGAVELDGGVAVDVSPKGGVRWVFALRGVVPDELEGELVVMLQRIDWKGYRRFE